MRAIGEVWYKDPLKYFESDEVKQFDLYFQGESCACLFFNTVIRKAETIRTLIEDDVSRQECYAPYAIFGRFDRQRSIVRYLVSQ